MNFMYKKVSQETWQAVSNDDADDIIIIISGMHHYECIAPNVDISLQSGRF